LRGEAAKLNRCGDERLIGYVLLQRRYELFAHEGTDPDHVVEIDRLIDWIRDSCPEAARTRVAGSGGAWH
jgi:hypothetical protein